MKINLLKKTLLATVLGLCALSANATTVDFTLESFGSSYSGSFSGTDTNGDHVLTLNELAFFNFSSSLDISVSTLSDFGSFDVTENFWNADASGWGQSNFAYFSWNNGNSSANTTNVFSLITTITASDVPEPVSIALFGLGALGLLTARRRQQ